MGGGHGGKENPEDLGPKDFMAQRLRCPHDMMHVYTHYVQLAWGPEKYLWLQVVAQSKGEREDAEDEKKEELPSLSGGK